MTEAEYGQMTEELKRECEQIFKKGHMDGLVNILRKRHPDGSEATTNAQILIASEFIPLDGEREQLVPLCVLSTSWDANKRYSGVGFATIPTGTMRIRRGD